MVRAYVKNASRAYPRLGVWATYYEKPPQDRIDYLSQLAWEHLSALPDEPEEVAGREWSGLLCLS